MYSPFCGPESANLVIFSEIWLFFDQKAPIWQFLKPEIANFIHFSKHDPGTQVFSNQNPKPGFSKPGLGPQSLSGGNFFSIFMNQILDLLAKKD